MPVGERVRGIPTADLVRDDGDLGAGQQWQHEAVVRAVGDVRGQPRRIRRERRAMLAVRHGPGEEFGAVLRRVSVGFLHGPGAPALVEPAALVEAVLIPFAPAHPGLPDLDSHGYPACRGHGDQDNDPIAPRLLVAQARAVESAGQQQSQCDVRRVLRRPPCFILVFRAPRNG